MGREKYLKQHARMNPVEMPRDMGDMDSLQQSSLNRVLIKKHAIL